VKTGTLQSIQAAIDQGADLNARDDHGWTALMCAVQSNQNPETIPPLLKAGADINAHDKDGMILLMVAAWNNENPEVIITLLKAGADAKAKNKWGKTAFDLALSNEKVKGTDAYWKLNEAQY